MSSRLMEPTPQKSIVMVAGEASGDLHGAKVIHELRQLIGNPDVLGVGGRAMTRAGARIICDNRDLAVVGVTEVLAKAPRILRTLRRLKRLLARLRPDLLILIDFPDFNLHLAAYAKKLNIPVLYYISPQIWAWRPGRVKKIKARVDHMAVILPFEKDFYEKNDVPVTFVGHPLLDDHPASLDLHHKGELDRPCIGLLPGSRDREVSRLLPPMLKAASLLSNRLAEAKFVVSCAPTIEKKMITSQVSRHKMKNLEVSTAPIGDILERVDLVWAASGTVTLEAAIHATPMIIIYTVSPLSHWLAKRLVRVDHIGLANLIAQKRIVPELVQSEVTPQRIAAETYLLLTDPMAFAGMRHALNAIRHQLGAVGASKEVAKIAATLMEKAHAL